MKLQAKLYYDNVLQKYGQVKLLDNDAILFIKDNNRYMWIFLEKVKINNNKLSVSYGKWKAIITNEKQFRKIAGTTPPKSKSPKRHSTHKDMTVADLKKLCKEKGITGYSKLNKAELQKKCK